MRVVSARRTLQIVIVLFSLWVFLKLQALWTENFFVDIVGVKPLLEQYLSAGSLRRATHREKHSNSFVANISEKVGDDDGIKRILAYTSIYGNEFDIKRYAKYAEKGGKTDDPLAECEYRCEWSTNRADYNRSDAVVFHLYNNLENKDFVLRYLPKRLRGDQKWVLMIREPPAFYYPQQMKLLNGMFNLTMTYQSDSDVHIPYGTYWKISPADAKKARRKLNFLTLKNKKKVTWLVSNCVTSSQRETYVKELQKHIEIDIFGNCGKSVNQANYKEDAFKEDLGKEYLFYIAFENSDCDDYITEKFWTSLMAGMIPVVRGRRILYKKFAPPNSYIHADSFKTPKHLANYLLKVSNNLTLLRNYHQWRTKFDASYRIFTVNRKWACDLCERVHNSRRQTVDVYKEFSEDTRCFTYKDRGYRNRSGERVEDITRW